VEVPLIPRYFDLLVLLIERRNEAVHRQEIFDAVWADVIVSDGALSQAVRILRKTLGDDPREPVFIRTVSRHGYRFIFSDVIEEDDDTPLPRSEARRVDRAEAVDPFEEPLDHLLGTGGPGEPGLEDEEALRREAAETLHALGTAEALRRLDRRPGHEKARAFLRDTRWDVPDAGPVPLLGQPGALATTWNLVWLRLRRAVWLSKKRWASATGGGAVAGLFAGILGGLILRFGPGSSSANSVLVALPLVGLTIGGLGAAGVGAGLASAEALVRSYRGLALVVLGSLGGGAMGATAHLLGRWTLEGLFGHDLSPVAGGFEGLVIGGAAGLGYALSAPRAEGGMATPRGSARLRAAALTGLTCALAATALAASGSYLGAMSLDFMAQSFPGSQVSLAPLAGLLGESEPGPLTRTAVSAWEGLMFGFGLILGLTRRPTP
jgi:DNA-binding winged helix-turn-helix (wHTH) protein